MDFWRTVVVLVRRWYITVPAFFGTLALAAAAYIAMPAQYQSVSVLVVTTPLTGGTAASHAKYPDSLTNPMLNFDRSVSLTASIVIQQMSSPEIAAALDVAPGGAIRYQVTNGSSNPELLESGPFLFVQGNGPSPEAAESVTQKVASMAAQILAKRQNDLDAPPSTHMSIHEVVPPTAAQQLKGSSLRAAAAAGALACLASLAAAFGFESLTTHRRRRRVVPLSAHPAATAVDASSAGTLGRRPSDLEAPPPPRLVHPSDTASANEPVQRLTHNSRRSVAGVLDKPADFDVDDGSGHPADMRRRGDSGSERRRSVRSPTRQEEDEG